LEGAPGQQGEAALAAGRHRDLEAVGREVLGHHGGQVLIVLDHEDGVRHRRRWYALGLPAVEGAGPRRRGPARLCGEAGEWSAAMTIVHAIDEGLAVRGGED